MKTGILALFMLLALSQSEALKCYCGGTYKYCSDRVETCTGFNQVCASVQIYAGSRPSYFQSCMGQYECAKLNYPTISTARCCSFDLCNR